MAFVRKIVNQIEQKLANAFLAKFSIFFRNFKKLSMDFNFNNRCL